MMFGEQFSSQTKFLFGKYDIFMQVVVKCWSALNIITKFKSLDLITKRHFKWYLEEGT